MKLLIVYGTTEGQTRKVAEFLKAEADKTGAHTAICDANCNPISPEGYDGVIIATSMHMHKYQASITHYVQSYMAILNDMPSAFVSVSLSALSKGYDEESYKELQDLNAHYLIDTGWKPVMTELTAGALRYTEYDFMKKFIMRQIAKRGHGDTDTTHDHEYTDWERLKVFVSEFIRLAKTRLTLTEEIA